MVNVGAYRPNVRHFQWFLFGMSPDVPAFKVRIFTTDFKFGIEVN